MKNEDGEQDENEEAETKDYEGHEAVGEEESE